MFSVFDQVGLQPAKVAHAGGLSSSIDRVAIADDDQMTWYSPRNPIVWLGGLMAVTVGLASVAGSVRIGKAKVSVSAGKG